MNPALFIGEGMHKRTLSHGDIERVHKIYGCAGESCNVDEIYKRLLRIGSPQVSEEVAH